jgi:hypothetical protein
MIGMARESQVTDENRFSIWAPEPLKQEWDTEENAKRGFFMDKVSLGGHQKVAWICADCGNHWNAKIGNRTSGGTGCPKCARKKNNQVSKPEYIVYYYLSPYFPDIVSQAKLHGVEFDLHLPSRNTVIEYDGKHWHKDKKTKDENKHENLRQLKLIRIREKGLPIITSHPNVSIYEYQPGKQYIGLNEVIETILVSLGITPKEGEIDVQRDSIAITALMEREKIENSIAVTHKAEMVFWDKDRNKGLNPESFTARSSEEAYFFCKTCRNSYKSKIYNRLRNSGDCKSCANTKKSRNRAQVVIKRKGSLVETNPEVIPYWSNSNPRGPEHYTVGSSEKVEWYCKTCYDVYHTRIGDRIKGAGNCSSCAAKLRNQQRKESQQAS